MDAPANGTGAAHKQRSDSSTSTSSSGSPYKRSSGLFSSLEQQKRSNDPAQMARRHSVHDQMPSVGLVGQWWRNFVRGTK